MNLKLIYVIFAAINAVNSARILGLFTTPTKSHLLIHTSLAKGLAARGHELTVVQTHPTIKQDIAHYREIYLDLPENEQLKKFRAEIARNAEKKSSSIFDFHKRLNIITGQANDSINHPRMQQLMREEEFDLVLLGWFVNDFQLGVAAHFKCPSIVIGTMQAVKPLRDLVGNPADVTHVANIFLSLPDNMSFWERTKNYGATILEHFTTVWINYYYQEKLYESNFPSGQLYPSFDEVKKNVSLVFVNHHFSQGGIRAYVPGMIEVGGMQIKPIPSPLPADIKEWLDNANDGVIYFSLGSNVKSTSISEEKRVIIINALAKLKQKVLWKWEDDELPDRPDNIKIGKWLPQDDILTHPNVRLFISHCGLSSINEAKYHGVPILGIPFFGDQESNLEIFVRDGGAVSLPYNQLNDVTFAAALKESLTNPIYGENVKRMSHLYRDRPQSALDTAIYWTEYVIRHGGAKHMQSPAVNFNFFQFYSLDIIGFILFVFIRIYFAFKGIRFVYRKCKLWLNKDKVKSD